MSAAARFVRLGIPALACAALLASLALPAVAAEQVPIVEVARVRLDVDVWINKDEGGIFRPGESMRVYFRPSADAYVLVYNIDTEGYIHLVYPYTPNDPSYVDGGRTYQIPSRRDPYDLVADGPTGIEYVVAVASPYPFRNLPWYLSPNRTASDRAGRAPEPDEEVEDETDAEYIVGDPYSGIDRINRRICPPGRESDLATSETYFYIERRVEYPRYVCADCHFGQPYFDPFIATCSVFDIRIDATWARYAPIRIGTVRPRYYYRIRSQAPTRYRAWKEQWSSLDGKAALRERFTPERERRIRPERGPRRYTPPEFRDLRRERTGRFWQGRDQVLKLRERRLQDIRERQEETRRKSEVERRRERSEPSRREDLERRERPRDRDRAEPPRERPEARERERRTDRGEGRREAEARKNEERRRDEAKRQNEAKERVEEKRHDRDDAKKRDRDDAKERGRDRDEARERGRDRGR